MPPPPPKATRRPSDACSEAGSDATDIGSEASSVSSTRKRPLELTEASYPQLTGASHPLKPSGGASVNGGASTSSALANAGGWLEAVAKRPARRAVATHLDGSAARVPSASAVASVEGGCCKWCLCSLTMQHPDGESKCRSRIFPNIRDWKKTPEFKRLCQPLAAVTRSTGPPSADISQEPAAHGRSQTTRTPEQQVLYEAAYGRWYKMELRRIEADANRELDRWIARLHEPLVSRRPSGTFSDLQMLRIEFITLLPSKVKPELFVRGAEDTLNNSAAQVFARDIRKIDAFSDGVASARMPGEEVDNNFALAYKRYERVPERRARAFMDQV